MFIRTIGGVIDIILEVNGFSPELDSHMFNENKYPSIILFH